MTTTISGTVRLAASRAVVWAKLNDVAILKSCISGCRSVERRGEARFAVVVMVQIGPVAVSFRGDVDVVDVEPPNRYGLVGAGAGGLAGLAKGRAWIALAEAPGGCTLSYRVQASADGWIVRFGDAVIATLAKYLADRFFAAFALAVRDHRIVAVEGRDTASPRRQHNDANREPRSST